MEPDSDDPIVYAADLVVIGSGLAGLCAALKALECGLSRILVVEKEGNHGGNSNKATSGMSFAVDDDDVSAFAVDVSRAAGKSGGTELIKCLVGKSRETKAWLETFDVVFNASSRCGGHSRPRTHRFVAKDTLRSPPFGKYIIDKLFKRVSECEQIGLMLSTRAVEIVPKGDRGFLVRILNCGDPMTLSCKAVVVATGGFSSNKALLKEHAPDASDFPTTNGPFALGEGLALLPSPQLVDMDKVQIHPTAFCAPTKGGNRILAPEALRGVGGVLICRGGRRFCNELDNRAQVTRAILDLPEKRCFLVMTASMGAEFGPNFGFYVKMKLLSSFSLGDAEASIGCSPEALERTLLEYSSGSPDRFGRADRENRLDYLSKDEPLYFGEVAPAIHYCMGGLAVDASASVPGVPGVFAAGEVTGGLHGRCRLAGNSLLDCAVFGSIAGESASKFIL